MWADIGRAEVPQYKLAAKMLLCSVCFTRTSSLDTDLQITSRPPGVPMFGTLAVQRDSTLLTRV